MNVVIQTSLEHIHDATDLYQNLFYNNVLNLYIACSNADLSDYVLNQQSLQVETPQTAASPSIYSVTCKQIGLRPPARYKTSGSHGSIVEKDVLYEGASFARCNNNDGHANETLERITLSKQALEHIQAIGLMFCENGEVATRPDFADNWHQAIGKRDKNNDHDDKPSGVFLIAHCHKSILIIGLS